MAKTESPLFEQFYSFPPFFTLQPTPQTKSRQLDLWTKLLQSSCESSSQFILTRNEPIFTNSSIKRTLSNDFITELFNHMIKCNAALPNTRTNVSPQSPQKPPLDSIIILFIPKQKWYDRIYGYAKASGLQNGGIATTYEILNHPDFSGMNDIVLENLLKHMETDTRNIEVIWGDGGGVVDGIKFF